jgi:hypothetical protein
MPTPIGLVSQQSAWNYLTQGDDNFSLSDIQKNLLEMSGIPVREASKTDPRIVVALEMILKNESQDLTALAELNRGKPHTLQGKICLYLRGTVRSPGKSLKAASFLFRPLACRAAPVLLYRSLLRAGQHIGHFL